MSDKLLPLSFEEYLEQEFMKEYHGPKDDFSDRFDKWIQTLDADDFIECAELWNRRPVPSREKMEKTVKAWALVDKYDCIEPSNGAWAIFTRKFDAEFQKGFYKTTNPKVSRCTIIYEVEK